METPYMKLHDEHKHCGEANFDELSCGDMVVGMAYVPMQQWKDVKEPQEALARGTQFPDLDKPFFGEDVWGCR